MSSSTLPLHYIYQAADGLTAKDAPIIVLVHGYGSHETGALQLMQSTKMVGLSWSKLTVGFDAPNVTGF